MTAIRFFVIVDYVQRLVPHNANEYGQRLGLGYVTFKRFLSHTLNTQNIIDLIFVFDAIEMENYHILLDQKFLNEE